MKIYVTSTSQQFIKNRKDIEIKRLVSTNLNTNAESYSKCANIRPLLLLPNT